MTAARATPPPAHLTVRRLPRAVARALEQERRRRGTSLNQTVIDLLGERLGVEDNDSPSNGLRRLAGTWSAAELRLFEVAVAETSGQIDDELWR